MARIHQRVIKLKSQPKWLVRIFVLLGAVLGGIFAFISHPVVETNAQEYDYYDVNEYDYLEDDILDDEMYPEDFEDFEEELDEEYGENIPQEIYDNTKGDTYDLATFEKAVKEVAYAYYMRGPRIQYNSLKANASGSWLSPEEATTQDSNYLVCSAFTRNVYYDLLKIKIPTFTDDLINYTTGHIGSPEVVGYGVKSGGNFIMKIYDSGVEYMVYENPNLSDIIPYLRIGDILTYNGHTLMVYDLVYDDETGNIDDVILMQSAHGEGKGYVKTKIGVFKEGSTIGRVNAFLYHNSKTGVDGLLEGSLNLISIKNESYWKKIGTSSGKTNYSILRFVQEDESGNVVLTYGGYSDFSLPDKTKDRLKFSKLFIEKTVSEHDDDVVELGSTMKYIIFVKNNSNEDYTDDLIITENLSNYVTYIEYTGSKSGIYFNKSGLILEWNVGKLRSGEEVTIEYSVDVDKGNIGDIIISTGSVGKIPSAKIKNEIGKVLNEEQGNDIKNAFENLKSDYNGKELIDKIYEQSLGIDLNFKEFDITNLINNSNLYSTSYTTISGNQKNSFYKMILNKYWSTLKLSKYNYENIPTIYAYLGKYWRPLSYSSRRADTINSENFRTGDILIYTNTNDNTYTYSEASGLTIKPITYENGEYAYIYIDGKFVGVNLGNDGVKDQQTGGDDRNEFTRQYYIDNSLSWYSHSSALSGKTNEFKESLQLQTLFGKNYYVILRPSLIIRNITYELDGGSNDSNNPSAFILGRDIELKEPTRTGYVFSGWYTDSEYTTQVTNTNELTDDVVLYAKWMSGCTFQGVNMAHGNSLTVYSVGSTTCPATCITGTVTCNNGTVLGNTEYSNLSCNLLSVSCDSDFTLTSTGSHGIYESCTPYTVSNNLCTPGITVYKLSNCANGYHTENGSGCTSNTKMVLCTQSGRPENSSYVTGNVQVTWNGERNNGSWSTPDNCGWTCDSGYTKVGNGCRPELTTREKAFQEVAYAYYMRGPYIHYNSAKGVGHDFSPEEATSQDYNYLACGLYVLNVYRQLLGHLSGNIITFPYNGGQSSYAKYYIGKRPEVIGYGRLQTNGVDSGSLYWRDGTTQYSSGHNIVNPDKSYIISQLKIGDILGYDGHVTMVYDYKYDENGNIEDVYLIHSIHNPQYRVHSKMNLGVTVYDNSGNSYDLSLGHNKYGAIRYNYFDRTAQSEHHPDARVEGTVQLNTMSNISSVLKFNTGNYSSYYLILRFVTTDSSGNSILSINGTYNGYYECSGGYNQCSGYTYLYNNKKIDYSDVVQSRLKYNKLYTEKTVDKWDNSVVGVDDELTYTIKIQNNSNKAYDDDLIVKENIDTNLVEYLSYNYTKNGILANDAQLSNNGNQLQWNIGKLNSGDEVIIQYTVKVRPGNIGETIESTGMVDDIPSGTLTNTIGKNIDKGENLKIAYNNLKNNYTGKFLINEIYREVYGIDLNIDKIVEINTGNELDTGGLIYYNNKKFRDAEIRINKKSQYSGMVLNGYFNASYKNINDARAVDKLGDEITITRYGFLPVSVKSNDVDKRADTIFPGNFQTGDILIYKNGDDLYYNWKTSPGYVYVYHINTYENGEYAYIYIDGKFVGVNLGNDLIWTGDDRNEFTTNYFSNVGINSRYYKDSGVGIPQNIPGGFNNWLHYQSLFGKEAYVILRPSLMIRDITYELSGGTNNEDNPTAFILGRDIELKEPTRTGYVFSGWYTDSEYTNQVYNTNELTDDVVLYARWELNTFAKAFQEVAYAYYMRGPYVHYNSAKGRGHDFSPEEATSQDYNYLACGLYVLNVYRELLGNFITFPYHGGQNAYAQKYIGKRPEVIGYGEKSGGNLYWWDETTQYSQEPKTINPTKNDIINQLQIGDIFGYEGHVTMVYDYKYNESGDIEDVYLIHAIDSPQYRVYSKMNLGVTVYDKSGTGYELSIGHNKWSAIRYNNFNRTAQSEHHPDAIIEGTVQLNTMSKINQKLEFNTGNYLSHYYILRFVTDDGSGNSILSINGTGLAGYRECSTCSYIYYSGQINYSDSVQSRLKYNKLYIEKTVNKWDNSIVGAGDELIYTIRIQNNSDQAYDDDLIIKENINTDLVENLSLYSYEKNGTQIQEIQLLNDGNQLQWNIGKLNSGDEVIIEYTVKVRPGNIGETIESTGMVGDIPSGIITNTIGKNTDKGVNLKAAYNNLNNNFTGKILINEIYKEVYGIDLELDKIVEINTGNELDTGALIYYNNKWGSRNNNWDNVEMQINKKSPYSGMVLNGYFNVLYKNINDAHAVNKSGDEITITRYGFPAIAVKANDVDKRADTIFPGNFQTGDILIYKNSNDLYYNWKTSPGYAYVSHTNTYENGEYVYIYMDGKFVGMNLGNDLTGARDDRNEFTTNYYSNAGIDSRYYTDSGVGIPQNIPGGFNNWLHYQTLFGKDAYVVLRPSLVIRNISYELSGGTNDTDNPSVFILGRDVELKEPTKTGYVFSGWYTDSGYTTQVTNTNELADDVVLYAKWENSIHELTTFEKAFQEVAYAYYMRGPYIHYNVAKGKSDVLPSPEESTCQDYNYMACALYAMNVFKELLGIDLSYSDTPYTIYGREIGNRKEVIGRGELQTSGADSGSLYWYDGSKNESGELNVIKDPAQSYVISQLKIGDILHYAGHVMLVYDLVYDNSGNVVDAYLLHAMPKGYYYTKGKGYNPKSFIYDISGNKVSLNIGHGPWSNLYYNINDRRGVYEESKIEGTLALELFTERADIGKILLFDKSNSDNKYVNNYEIIRFVTTEGGKDVLNFYGDVIYGGGNAFQGETVDDGEIEYSDSVKSRLKYSKLYIEKTVDKRDNNIVQPNDELTYKVIIKNESKEDYENYLVVKENINTNLVQNLSRYVYTKNGVLTNDVLLQLEDDDQLQWNIGKLNSGDEVIIEYTVKVKTGHIGETIESTGLVDDIPSGKVKNKIGKNTNKGEELKQSYNNLRGVYTGKNLINQIYEEIYGINLELDNLKILTNNSGDESGLIFFNNKWGSWSSWDDSTYMSISVGNKFSGMVLNSYFNALYKAPIVKSYNSAGNEITVQRYALPAIGLRNNDPNNRANTIYPTDFQTGDILMYINENDIKYSLLDNGKTARTYLTYENGEYAYIYIDGKFVGVNSGNDLTYTGDDRNEFTTGYYINNSRPRYGKKGEVSGETNELEEWLQYQTLFGKDAYVILRPSLMIRDITYELSGGTNNEDNPNAFILGRNVELKEPTKTGYVFSGWYTDLGYTNQVYNTNELTDDVVLYAKWENSIHELTTFEKAFQEVAYAYYMRGPYLHYNVAKGYGDVNAESPEEATTQDYNYLACGLYVMNVYKELLNIKFYQSTRQYAATYFGERPEVIGYGIKTGGKLYRYDKDHDEQNPLENPTTGDIIPQLKIGDIIHNYGHEMLVYDLIYDGSGNVVDVYLLHANGGGGYLTRKKTHGDKKIYNISGNKVSIGIGHEPWASLYYNNIDNRGLYTGSRIEGTIKLQKLSEKGGNNWLFDGNINHYASDYAILRFVTNTGGKDVLSFDGTYKAYTGEKIDNEEIGMDYYSDRVKSRLKYSKLYIEKTVDKRDNNMVEPNDELIYTIKIQNNSDKSYDNDLIVKENIDINLVDNLGSYSYIKNGESTSDIQLISNNGNQLQWNIGKLNSMDEVIIEYKVKVKIGHIGETIESTGLVDNIPSGMIKNRIGKNFKEQDSNLIDEKYGELKNQYTGKILINEIYKSVYNVDLGLDNLNIKTDNVDDESGVIYFNNKWGTGSNRSDNTYLYINKKNTFSGMVLNSYFNALYKKPVIKSYNASGNEIEVQIYALPSLSTRESDPDERANTIFPTDFQTGDILIYINENDIVYSTGENITVTGEDNNVLYSGPSTKELYRTYENGEYAYIYINGKFVGVNLGNNLTENKDNRDEFTSGYYANNQLNWYTKINYTTSLKTGFGIIKMPDGGEEWLQYQTLYGKDAYVILRPSLMIRSIDYELDGGINDDQNPRAFILRRDVELKEPTRTGYVFNGWYTDSEYTNQVYNTNELTDDVVLYAKWENASCIFNGSTINHGESVTGYRTNSVAYGETCESETRVCENGTLNGSYGYASCTVGEPETCIFNGSEINHGESVIGYRTNAVAYGEACESETRTCENGTLNGSYGYASCTVGEPETCIFNGSEINHGESVTGYRTNSVAYGETCESETRICENGTLNGSYGYASCVVGEPETCIFNGSTINHGESVTGYRTNAVAYGETCESEIRICINGELSGTYGYSSCLVQAPGGVGGVSLRKDHCPNGDYSDSYYDGTCGTNTKDSSAKTQNNKMRHNSADKVVYDTLRFNPYYSDEMNRAYQFAYHYGITTKGNIKDADMNGKLTRIAMAKMLSQYAINVLGKEPDDIRQNKFADVSSKLDSDYDNGVTLAYQLGIMGINMKDNKFRPYDTVSRAEFVTALSRLLYGIEDGKDKYYITHMNLLEYLGIITNTDPTMKELRGYVMIMLMRSGK